MSTPRPDASRRLQNDEGALPDFLIIGAAKSGTTSLYHYLKPHPELYMSPKKELNFFDAFYDRGFDWYRRQFDGAHPHQLVGEASVEYMYNPDVPPRMARAVPDARLIAILRNPVDRAFSDFWALYRAAFPRPHTFEEVVRREMTDRGPIQSPPPWPQGRGVLDKGRYLIQLERVLEFYPRDSLLVLLFEDLRADPRAVMSSVCRFLGVSEASLLHEPLEEVHNKSTRLRSPKLRRLMLRTHAYKRHPRISRVIEGWNRKAVDRSPMDPALRSELVDWYREDNEALARWLGRDLSMWNV